MRNPRFSPIALLTFLPLSLFAVERIVVMEIALSPCPYCVMGADAATSIAQKYPGKLLLLEYDIDGLLHNDCAGDRALFYEMSGFPTAVFDGVETYEGVMGDVQTIYDSLYQLHAPLESPLEIELSGTTDALLTSTSGTLQAGIINISDQAIEGTVHFTVTESSICCDWYLMPDTMCFIERAMLPDAAGEPLTLAPGEEKVVVREFTIDTTWPHFTQNENVQFGCFVQGADKEIYQGAVLDFDALGVAEEQQTRGLTLEGPTIVKGLCLLKLVLDEPSPLNLVLYDATGRLVKMLESGTLSAGDYTIPLDISAFPAGMYFIKATAGAHSQTDKLIVLN